MLYFAHVGDSRGILVRTRTDAEALGKDHRPDDPVEKERVEMAGGTTYFFCPVFQRPVFLCSQHIGRFLIISRQGESQQKVVPLASS